jgi:hypothetical protein
LGLDISSLLLKDPTDASLIRTADGAVRDTMVWHFPNRAAQDSTIRIGDYKLVRNYNAKLELDLYRLYDSEDGLQNREDIEAAKDLATAMPEKTAAINASLIEILTEMKASYPYYNPNCKRLPKSVQVPAVLSHSRGAGTVMFSNQENGAWPSNKKIHRHFHA